MMPIFRRCRIASSVVRALWAQPTTACIVVLGTGKLDLRKVKELAQAAQAD